MRADSLKQKRDTNQSGFTYGKHGYKNGKISQCGYEGFLPHKAKMAVNQVLFH